MPTSASDRSLIITADDTTGALESAALMADHGWPVRVVPHALIGSVTVAPSAGVVIDLRSRHEPADAAAARMRDVLGAFAVRVHKIDSTLRGNWPAEIAAATSSGRRVLVVPAYPAAGRICSGGIVTEHGVPVDRSDHGRDPRAPVPTSRPATLLHDAVELPTPADVAEWLEGDGSTAVADATDIEQLTAVVAHACRHDAVLLVGTAAMVGAAAAHVARTASPPLTRRVDGPVLVVCGSLHPVSRAQIAALIDAGAQLVDDASVALPASVSIVASSVDRHDDSSTVATSLARRAHRLLQSSPARTIVLMGGDTAEAFIGDRIVAVDGSLDVGVASGAIELDGVPTTLVAKPGAFGTANTLVDLMSDALIGDPT